MIFKHKQNKKGLNIATLPKRDIKIDLEISARLGYMCANLVAYIEFSLQNNIWPNVYFDDKKWVSIALRDLAVELQANQSWIFKCLKVLKSHNLVFSAKINAKRIKSGSPPLYYTLNTQGIKDFIVQIPAHSEDTNSFAKIENVSSLIQRLEDRIDRIENFLIQSDILKNVNIPVGARYFPEDKNGT